MGYSIAVSGAAPKVGVAVGGGGERGKDVDELVLSEADLAQLALLEQQAYSSRG